jgi:hypothetical protein
MESAVKNLFQISKEYTKKRDSVMVSLFLQKWFVSRIKDESDIFQGRTAYGGYQSVFPRRNQLGVGCFGYLSQVAGLGM